MESQYKKKNLNCVLQTTSACLEILLPALVVAQTLNYSHSFPSKSNKKKTPSHCIIIICLRCLEIFHNTITLIFSLTIVMLELGCLYALPGYCLLYKEEV